MSRRGFFTTIGVATGAVVLTTAGQSFAVLAPLDVLGPRKPGVGPQHLPVNKTARSAGVIDQAMSPDWRLTITHGSTTRTFTLAELRALPQYDVALPISCVEGWSQVANWRGPRLRDLTATVAAPKGSSLRIASLQRSGGSALTTMEPEFASDELTLVALQLEGQPLGIDHGYPARLIAPARPGVLQTKWLDRIEVVA